ncbi:MAG: ATP-binding protein, partial [Candidatus Binatus sp.]
MARRKADSSQSLFPPRTPLSQPLADRMRPRTLDEIVGQEHLLGPGKFLSQMVAAHVLHSMILWGPPGTGKTTLALV